MKILFLSLAERELRDAFEWYERQSVGLGAEFLSELDQTVDRIRRYPESCPVLADGARRALISRFPYGLWYALKRTPSWCMPSPTFIVSRATGPNGFRTRTGKTADPGGPVFSW